MQTLWVKWYLKQDLLKIIIVLALKLGVNAIVLPHLPLIPAHGSHFCSVSMKQNCFHSLSGPDFHVHEWMEVTKKTTTTGCKNGKWSCVTVILGEVQMAEVTFVGVRRHRVMHAWKGVREWENVGGMQGTAASSCCVFVHTFVRMCMSICVCAHLCMGVCEVSSCVVCVLRLRWCAQRTDWWNNGCHLSAWDGSVMDCICVGGWVTTRQTKGINSKRHKKTEPSKTEQ